MNDHRGGRRILLKACILNVRGNGSVLFLGTLAFLFCGFSADRPDRFIASRVSTVRVSDRAFWQTRILLDVTHLLIASKFSWLFGWHEDLPFVVSSELF